jgi:hypothetical protein
MIVYTGLREWSGIAGARSTHPKTLVAQRKQKRDAKRMVFSTNAEQVRSHVRVLIGCLSESIGINNVLAGVVNSAIIATPVRHARRSTRRSGRKLEST